MLELIKKTILTGVGAAVVTSEKVQGAFTDLVAQGKVTAAEAMAVAEKISADGKREFEAASEEASRQVHHVLNKSAEATQQKLSEFEARLKAMEARREAARPKRKAVVVVVKKKAVAARPKVAKKKAKKR
jgi:polyhydroxyalkanoate synthesis regulator phasin